MPRKARLQFLSLRSSLVNLPISLYGQLVEQGARPQSLAIHLKLRERDGKLVGASSVEAYVGWTGMMSSSSLASFQATSGSSDRSETIEIDPQFASGIGFRPSDIVDVGVLQDLPKASRVETEPLTTDDWEIVELHAGYIEQHFLSQVRAANVGQEVDVWVLGRTRVSLRIVSVDSGDHKVALLSNSTEVSVAPKMRGSKTSQPKTEVKQIKTSEKQPDSSNKDTSNSESEDLILRVLPARLYFGDNSILLENAAWVSSAVNFEYISNRDAYKINTGFVGTASLRHLISPYEVPIDSKRDAGDSSQTTKNPFEGVVYNVYSSDLVPVGHAILQGTHHTKVDWGVVCLSLTPTSISHPSPKALGKSQPVHHGLFGMDTYINKCLRFCTCSLNLLATARSSHLHGLLVTGRSGFGKTSLVKAVARLLEDQDIPTHVTYVDLATHANDRISQLQEKFRQWGAEASWRGPSVVVLDNIDRVVNTEAEHAESFRSRHIAETFVEILSAYAKDTVFLATAQSETRIHPKLRSSHFFKQTLVIKPLEKDARKAVITQRTLALLGSHGLKEDSDQSLNFSSLAAQTEGYSAADLNDLVSRALHQAAMRTSRSFRHAISIESASVDISVKLLPEDFNKAHSEFTPLPMRSLDSKHADISWTDIGGLQYTKRVLRETLEWPAKYAAIFAKCPLRLRSGLLLYGYPGCGKTMLASAVAKECGLNFIGVKGPELLNKYIGASEKSVRELFERASAAKPCVLFFDEFDSIAPKRGHDSTGVTDRVVNQLLTQMDGAEGLDGVYVLAATSRPDLIDSALLRPGRLDKSLICDIPSHEERLEILQVLSRRVPMSADVDLDALASLTEGFCGADLQALVYNAHLEVVHTLLPSPAQPSSKNSDKAEDLTFISSAKQQSSVLSKADVQTLQRRLRLILDNRESPEPQNFEPNLPHSEQVVLQTHLLKSLKSTRPSIPSEERQRLTKIYRAFVQDRSGELPVPSETTSVGSRASLM